MNRLHFIQYFVFATLVFFSCANPRTPMGGPRDTSPPIIVESYPKNNAVSTQPKFIAIRFNEFINLDNPKDNIIISPPLEKFPKIMLNNKSLIIELDKDQLKENTTYSIHFNAAIKDINEGNFSDSLNYVFSTGDSIDDFQLFGTVYDAETKTVETDFIVAAYKLNDSLDLSNLPDYYTRTNKNGAFLLKNLKKTDYFILAFNDENKNLKKDLKSEKLGFRKTFYANDSTEQKPINIYTFLEQTPPKITGVANKTPGKISVFFNQAIHSFEILNLDSNDLGAMFFAFNTSKDSLNIFYAQYPPAKNQLDYQVLLNDEVYDTLKLKFSQTSLEKNNSESGFGKFFPEVKQKKLRQEQAESDTISLKILPTKLSQGILFNRPISSIDTQKIIINEGTTSNIEFKISTNKENLLEFHVKQGSEFLLYDSTLIIHFAEGALTDLYQIKNNPFTVNTLFESPSKLGSLKLNLTNLNKSISYIFSIYNVNNQAVATKFVTNESDFTWEIKELYPDNYTVKIIEDLDNNQKWTNGDFSAKTQPENIYIINKIEIRSKWENQIEYRLP